MYTSKNKLELGIVTGTIFLFAILNSLHVITQWLANPPDRLFTGIAHYFADYFLYVDSISQGTLGKLTTTPHFTNELLPDYWIYWFNGLLGLFGRVFYMSPFAIYNVVLLLFVVILGWLWYYLMTLIFPKNSFARITSLVFILCASSFFDVLTFLKGGNIELLGQFWFAPTPALNRLGGVPHQVFQTILFVSLLIVYAKLVDRLNRHYLFIILLIVLTVLGASANPIQLLVFLFSAALFTLLEWSIHKNSNSFLKKFFPLVMVSVVSLPTMLITNGAFNHPVLASAKIWEASQHVSLSIVDFLLSVGPLILFFPFGLYAVRNERETLTRLFLLYGFVSLIFFFSPIPKLLETTRVRYLHPAPYGALAVLSTMGVVQLSYILYSFSRKKIRQVTFHLFFVIIVVLLSMPPLYKQIQDRVSPQNNSILDSDLNHIPVAVVEAFMFLKTQPTIHPVVLTDPRLPYDVAIPAMTGKTSFTGHPIHTLYPDIKENLRNEFFSNALGQDGTKLFLQNHRIGYIVTKPNWPLPYSFLEKIFENTAIAIWKKSL